MFSHLILRTLTHTEIMVILKRKTTYIILLHLNWFAINHFLLLTKLKTHTNLDSREHISV